MSSEDTGDLSKFYRINRTIRELVRDRGYEVSEDEINISMEAFKAQYVPSGSMADKLRLNFYAAMPDEADGSPGARIYVFYSPEKSVGIKVMRDFIGILGDRSCSRGILIFPTNMTPAANKLIHGVQSDFTIDTFQEAELLVNITHHHLVPLHEVLNEEEKSALLQKYRLKESQLPRIQMGDPVARYYGLKRGQVVKITRPSETAGRYVSYRLCA